MDGWAAVNVVDEPTAAELVPATGPPQPPATLLGTDPDEILVEMTRRANILAEIVKKQKLASSIQGRLYVRVEGWTCLGSLCGVYPAVPPGGLQQLENGWRARVEARTLTGALVGAAEAVCLRSERTWASRDDYALCSMAQTRATSKALRQPLGFIMALAGFEATPAEEMPPVEAQVVEARAPSHSPALAPTSAKEEPLATEKTAKLIWALIGQLNKAELVPRDKLLEGIRKAYGTEDPRELTQQQASDLIDRLKKKLEEAA
jgi:hypothetical protein